MTSFLSDINEANIYLNLDALDNAGGSSSMGNNPG